ncbi:DUF935 domain-containing protein [Patescibacteria group bacterium]|uniref:Portal protein n=1 Tax=viral metagenome TaxID=1070528 RepID=A0A6M3MA14_9ZZZZ|nr:DUF935 domain-containing protein [Patescibacteria group bacterium]
MENQNLSMKLGRMTRQRNRLASDTGLMRAAQWANLLTGDYNPDEISLAEYAKMMNYDAQVRAGSDLIGMGVLMKPWRIRHPDEEVVEVLTASLQKMRKPSLRSSMKQMLTAICYGYSVTEIVFQDYKKFWVPRFQNGLKTFDPNYIKFFTDEYGNLEKVQQQLGGNRVDLPLDRTLIWSHDTKFGNWYGESILRACYKNWFIKDAMLKFANIAYERFGAPIMLGYASTVNDQSSVQDAISHLYAYSQATILRRDKDDPTGIDILESKRAEMPFDRYINYQDNMILRRMLIGQNLFEGGGGVYGAKVPFDIILMRFEDFRLELIEQMDELLQIISAFNWDLEVEPRFDFAPLTTSDMASLRESIFNALDRGILKENDNDWVRQELGFPQMRKEKQFARALAGRYLKDPHAAWLASGKQTIIVNTSPYSKYDKEEVYIVGDGGIYGTMVQGEAQGPFSKRIQEKYQALHQISAAEWEDQLGDAKDFWIQKPTLHRKFDTPLKFEVPVNTGDYIRRVVPEGVFDEEAS